MFWGSCPSATKNILGYMCLKKHILIELNNIIYSILSVRFIKVFILIMLRLKMAAKKKATKKTTKKAKKK